MLYGTKSDKSKAVTYDKEELDEKFEHVTPDLPDIDTTPTSGSTNLVTSGGVKAADDALYAKLKPSYVSNRPSGGVMVSSDQTVNLMSGIKLKAYTPTIMRFSGWATFDDGGAMGMESEGLQFGIGPTGQGSVIGPMNWAMKAKNIGGYGQFEFTSIIDGPPSSDIRVYVTNNTSEDVFINKMEFEALQFSS